MKLALESSAATRPAAGWTLRGPANRRRRTLLTMGICLLFVLLGLLSPLLISDAGLRTALTERNLAPSLSHLFGTDHLGRDMFTRTLHGLSLSLRVGVLSAAVSAVLGVALGTAAGLLGGIVDTLITWIIDVLLSLPHLVLLIMIAFAAGGGTRGVVIAVVLTHWMGLARVIRAEVLQLSTAPYIQLSRRFGHGAWWIARRHMAPHVFPQFLVGVILLFPHAILHEAGLTFIGIGLSPHVPAIGVILAEAMRNLSTGYWWLAIFPGLLLLLAVKLFDILGEHGRSLIDPKTSQE